MPEKYVRRLKDGRILIATPTLLNRRDCVPYDPETARLRIEAARKRLEDLKTERPEAPSIPKDVLDDSVELAKLEAEIKAREKENSDKLLGIDPDKDKKPTDESAEADRITKLLEEDPEIGKIKRMRTANSIESYILELYGEEVNMDAIEPDDQIEYLRKKALQLRTDRLLEKE